MSETIAASMSTLRTRAALLAAAREFFATRGVLEVETPVLSRAAPTDPAIESVTATVRSLGVAPCYLHTSPEFAMKRLLAAGSGDIYQICRVFRDDELGRWHQPEFTLLEWYRVGWDEQQLMTEVEAFITTVIAAAGKPQPPPGVRLTYAAALQDALGVPPSAPTETVVRALASAGVDVPSGLDHDAVLDLAFAAVVAPSFERDAVTFVYDYPASQAALARLQADNPAVAARFEVFSGGIELANGFRELTDAAEQRRRFEVDLEKRRARRLTTLPIDEEFLAALPAVPECAGVALGFDRLVALATGQPTVAAALSLAHR